jgi:peroxiredoxin (alkyl hydroperoxide reductase subunit C)
LNANVSRAQPPNFNRATSWSGVLEREGNAKPLLTPTVNGSGNGGGGGGQTRLQATFQVIKRISAGLSSPRVDYTPKKDNEGNESAGYFDVTKEQDES